MKKQLLVFLLVMLLPICAFAQITVETVSEGNGKLATNRYAFFEHAVCICAASYG